MKQWIEISHTQKKEEGVLYENGVGKKMVGHSRLKLSTFFWRHGECEWPLGTCIHCHKH